MQFKLGNINCQGCTNKVARVVREKFEKDGLVASVTEFIKKDKNVPELEGVLPNKLTVTILNDAKSKITPRAVESTVREAGMLCEFVDQEESHQRFDVPKRSFKKVLRTEEGRLLSLASSLSLNFTC
jgi:hypothetical protein